MFHTSSLPFDTTASVWDPNYVRNILRIPEDQLHILSNIPEWSAKKGDSVLSFVTDKGEIVLNTIDQQSNSQVSEEPLLDKANNPVEASNPISCQAAKYQSAISTSQLTLENIEKAPRKQQSSEALEITSSKHSFSQPLRSYSSDSLQNFVGTSKQPEICVIEKDSTFYINNKHSTPKERFATFLSSIKSPSLCRSFSLYSIDELGNQSWKNCKLKRSSSVPNLQQREPHSISLKFNNSIRHYQKIAKVLIEEYSKLKLLCSEPDKFYTEQEIINLSKEFFSPTQFDIEKENANFHKNKKVKYSILGEEEMDGETQFVVKKKISIQNILTDDLNKLSRNIEDPLSCTTINSEISPLEIDNVENNTSDKSMSDLFKCTKDSCQSSQKICLNDKTDEVNNCPDSQNTKFSKIQKNCSVSEINDTCQSTGPFVLEEKSHVKMSTCDESIIKTQTSGLNLTNSANIGSQPITCGQLASSGINYCSNLDVTIPSGQVVSSGIIDSSNVDVTVSCSELVSSGLGNSSNLDATIPCGQAISSSTSTSANLDTIPCYQPVSSDISDSTNLSSTTLAKEQGEFAADNLNSRTSLNLSQKNEKSSENTAQEPSHINSDSAYHTHLTDNHEGTFKRVGKKRKRNVERQARRSSETKIPRKVEEINFSVDQVKKMLNVMHLFLK